MLELRVYLAGPDVFHGEAQEIGRRKRDVCRQHGLIGIFPGDFGPAESDDALLDRGYDISRVLEDLMRSCDAMIANMTPFHGPSADVGTTYEMGFMRALGKPIFAYSNDPRTFAERVGDFWAGDVHPRPDGILEGPDGMAVEELEMADNLMLIGGIIASGGYLTVHNAAAEHRYTDLSAFTRCVEVASQRLMAAATTP